MPLIIALILMLLVYYIMWKENQKLIKLLDTVKKAPVKKETKRLMKLVDLLSKESEGLKDTLTKEEKSLKDTQSLLRKSTREVNQWKKKFADARGQVLGPVVKHYKENMELLMETVDDVQEEMQEGCYLKLCNVLKTVNDRSV